MNPTIPIRVQIFMETYAFGGPAKNLLATIARLQEKYTFQIVTFSRGHLKDSAFINALKERNIDYIILRESLRFDPRCIDQMGRRIEQFNPHILQVHNAKSRIYLKWLRAIGRRLTIPQIDFYHGETWTDKKQLLYNRIDRLLFQHAQHIIVVSEHQRHILANWHIPDNLITCIPNAIDITPPQPRKPSPIPHIITVGRFSQEKGHLIMLKALNQLTQQYTQPFKVTLLGDGPEKPALQNYLNQHPHLAKHITLPGYLNNPETYYAQADIFVLPSYTEGLPNVLLECSAYENAIVSTKAGGVEHLFTHEQEALLTDIGKPDQLANAIQRLLKDPQLRTKLGQAARKKVEQKYSMQGRAKALDTYYQTISSM